MFDRRLACTELKSLVVSDSKVSSTCRQSTDETSYGRASVKSIDDEECRFTRFRASCHQFLRGSWSARMR